MRAPEPAPRVHPKLAEVYRRQVERLEAALNESMVRPEAAEALRALIDKIVLKPGEKRGEVHAVLHGELGALLALGSVAEKNRTSISEVRLSVVAGARNHLCRTVVQWHRSAAVHAAVTAAVHCENAALQNVRRAWGEIR
ncbi:MAG: hypothetical protein RIM84_07260 [Alphaproteobacteria bacterium]